MPQIKNITAREILDSRGKPTVEATVEISSGLIASAQVPSGASTGTHEAHELRDGDKKRYNGLGVLKAVENVETVIKDALVGMDVQDQRAVDKAMIDLDGTDDKGKLGSNAILAVSMATARVAALKVGKPLYKHLGDVFGIEWNGKMPRPMMNIINGGRHADNSLTVQEFMIIPSAETEKERIHIGSQVYNELHKLLQEQDFDTGLGDEGGFAPKLHRNEQALQLLLQAIDRAGYRQGIDVSLALDVAASEFYKDSKYEFEDKKLTARELIDVYLDWNEHYPIISIEDGLDEDDWANWKEMNSLFNKKLLLIGDDLFVTNSERLQQGIDFGAANSILIKLNQIGTVTETMDTVQLAHDNDYTPVVSHRSGETIDDFISDLAVAVNAPFIKAGAPARGERVAKYNRLLAIEELLKKS